VKKQIFVISGVLGLFVALSASAKSAGADWGYVEAWCVGGPIQPSYAFWSPDEAEVCGNIVGSASHACARAVRVQPCWAYPWEVDAVDPYACRCAPGTPAVGTWGDGPITPIPGGGGPITPIP
jgi:hypothetical protein